MINLNDSNVDETASIESVRIECNASKGEIRTIVKHAEQSFRVGDASDNRSEERVTITERCFPTYSRTPGAAAVSLARSMARYTLATLPGVPVALYGA
jgi:hypothetical protein